VFRSTDLPTTNAIDSASVSAPPWSWWYGVWHVPISRGQFMHKGGELFRVGLAGKNGNPAAIAHAEGGGDVLGKDKLDILLVDE